MSATAAVALGQLGGHGGEEQGQLGCAQLVEEAGVVEARPAHHLTQADAFAGGVDDVGGLHNREGDAGHVHAGVEVGGDEPWAAHLGPNSGSGQLTPQGLGESAPR